LMVCFVPFITISYEKKRLGRCAGFWLEVAQDLET